MVCLQRHSIHLLSIPVAGAKPSWHSRNTEMNMAHTLTFTPMGNLESLISPMCMSLHRGRKWSEQFIGFSNWHDMNVAWPLLLISMKVSTHPIRHVWLFLEQWPSIHSGELARNGFTFFPQDPGYHTTFIKSLCLSHAIPCIWRLLAFHYKFQQRYSLWYHQGCFHRCLGSSSKATLYKCFHLRWWWVNQSSCEKIIKTTTVCGSGVAIISGLLIKTPLRLLAHEWQCTVYLWLDVQPRCESPHTSIWELLSVSSAETRPGKPSGSSCSGSWSCSWLALLLSMLRGFGGTHLLHRWL